MSKTYKIFLYCCIVAFGLFFAAKSANADHHIKIITNVPDDTTLSACLDTFQIEILITNDTTVIRTSEVLIRTSEVLIRSSEVLNRSSEVLKHIKQA